MHLDRNLIERLPKTDLHCHLDGSLRIETLIDLARKSGVVLPSYEPESLMAHMGYGRVRENLVDYLKGFDPLVAVLQSHEAIERVFYELCEDAAEENIWHLEIRYCPYLLTKQGLSLDDVVTAAHHAQIRALHDFSISTGQILCGLKHHSSKHIIEVAHLAARYKDRGVVGFDLAGPEAGFPIRDHLEAIFLARREHLFVTLHAGEAYGPVSIFEAVHHAAAHRIGHGTTLIQDPELMQYVVDHRIGVEACPISNWHTKAVASLDVHPIKKLLDAGVRVSINTDNRLVSDTTVTEEIMAVVEHLDFTLEDIKKLLQNGFKSAFLPLEKRRELLVRFNDSWAGLMA